MQAWNRRWSTHSFASSALVREGRLTVRKITTRISTERTIASRHNVFVDTGGWYAVVSQDDRHHAAATRYHQQQIQNGARLLTSDYILDETFLTKP